jgi:para-nitrobenzyl esterase
MTTVATTSGKISGVEKMGCLQFRGVPFAEPPVGRLRWKAPQPHPRWDGTRECTEFGAICPQALGDMERFSGARRQHRMDEDCLTLNVYTGTLDGPRPVMVWIHGGGFATGSSRLPWYSGHNFVRDGVVVVTVNYRLNGFGFLALDAHFGNEFADSGSVGILDQIAALRWVQENIASFGGDPSNVTIFGESAGGGSVGTLLASPGSKGLFHKAIPQSGASHWSHSPDIAARVSAKFLEAVGIAPGDVDGLRGLSTEQITDGVVALGREITSENAALFGEDYEGFALPFQPVWGGEALPTRAIDAVFDGAGAAISTLVGTTREEWKLFSAIGRNESPVRAFRPLRNLCTRGGRSVEELVTFYERAFDIDNELELRSAIETDRVFRVPAVRLAEAQVANGTPAWMYRFDWPSPAFDGRFGACHALEIPFVFDNLSAPGADVFTGGAAPQDIATTMHAAWVAFAKTGDPGWPAYDTERRATMLFDAKCTVADDPDGDTRRLWDGLL